jgi:hypothetical protein
MRELMYIHSGKQPLRLPRLMQGIIKEEKEETMPWSIKLVVKDRNVVEVKREQEDSVRAPWKEAEQETVKQEKTKVKLEKTRRTETPTHRHVKTEIETEDSDGYTRSRLKREREPEDSDDDVRWTAPNGKTKREMLTHPDPKELTNLNTGQKLPNQDRGASTPYHQDEKSYDESTRWICPQNYAAMEASAKNYGLIPMGVEKGVRTLIMHVPRGKIAWEVFQHVQPGGTLQVVKGRKGGKNWKTLGVRFTSPARYFPPGVKVSCLTIGVDDTEWQSLMTKPRRI